MLACFIKMEPVKFKLCMYEINHSYIARINSEINPPVISIRLPYP